MDNNSNLRRRLIIEEKKTFRKKNPISSNIEIHRVVEYTDALSGETGSMPEIELKRDYFKMDGTLGDQECYMKKFE